jgi:hypothetical protein
MKIQKLPQWFSLFLLVMIVTGCMQSTETSRSTSPIATASTASATETVQPTLTSTATDTSTPSSTPTVVPTLSVADARQRLLDLLATNGDCRLPCLWGITPGKSSNQEARNILMPLSSISAPETTYFDPAGLRGVLLGTISPFYAEDEQRLNIWAAYLYDEDGVVSSIGFRVQEEKMVTDSYGNLYGEPIFDFPHFAKHVEYYSLSHVLSEQGLPSSVFIQAAGLSFSYPVIPGKLDIVLLYPDQGIWVDYTLAGDYVGNVIRGCPANAHIQMELYPPGNPDSFFALLDQTNWGITKSGYKPLKEATSMSLDEFYQFFRNPTDKCIETPADLWPTPEAGGG